MAEPDTDQPAEDLVDQMGLRSMHVTEDGLSLELTAPRQLAEQWVAGAKALLGNHTKVRLVVGLAFEARYEVTISRLDDGAPPACDDPIECGHEAALGQGEAETARLRADLKTAEDTIRRVSMTRVWTNEDGRRFLFVDDLAQALGRTPADDHPQDRP